jgi:hypothetical protein
MSVDQEQALKEHEPRNGKVRGHHSLHAFLSGNPDPDISYLYHTDVVSSIA